jgi:hypothetical protein
MAMHNFKQSHLITKPCRMCRCATSALVKGVIQEHPVCADCRAELDRQFKVASIQRSKQNIASSKPAVR